LPASDDKSREARAHVAPRTPLEAQVARAFAGVLGVERVEDGDGSVRRLSFREGPGSSTAFRPRRRMGDDHMFSRIVPMPLLDRAVRGRS
jgi:hypothetical protein